jgi:hypothetical protein
MIRIVLGLIILLAVLLLARNLIGAVRDTESARRKAWDAPEIINDVAVLTAPFRAWAWWGGLAFLTGLANLTLVDRLVAGEGMADTWRHWVLLAVLLAVTLRRGLQLSEKITVTHDRIVSRNWLGTTWSLPLAELRGVGETEKTIVLDFGEGKTLPLSPWLSGRFWLGRELRRNVLGQTGPQDTDKPRAR